MRSSHAYSLHQTSPFAEIGDSWPIVMSEHLVTKDRISDLRGIQQVHFEQTGLEVRLFGLVLLQCIEQECCRGLDHVLRHEDVDDLCSKPDSVSYWVCGRVSIRATYPFDVNEWASFLVRELRREFSALFRADAHDMLQKADVVWLITDFFRVE